MRIHSSLATASELKGTRAARGQIQLVKSGWRSVELDPSSSKYQVKRARKEQGRIAHLYWNTCIDSTESRTMTCLQSVLQNFSGNAFKHFVDNRVKLRASIVKIT